MDKTIPTMLLGWYDRHHRELPWRVSPARAKAGEMADPYRVWLSEVMLQQTTVQAVKPFFAHFTARWPRVTDLADAPTDEVMSAWAGLGYYARARNLKACAEAVARDHGGKFPDTEEGLRALPGIGAYTAAAIAAIAFGRRAVVMDGNIERVVSRLFMIEDQLPAGKPVFRAAVDRVTPVDRAGDFAQAMMDLGATICTPKRPACVLCPLNGSCQALAEGEPETFPRKAAKKTKPVRLGAAFIALSDGAILLRKRPDSGLLGGMSEVPTNGWTARIDGSTDSSDAPFAAEWQPCGTVVHVFTHFELQLSVWSAQPGTRPDVDGWWQAIDRLDQAALPNVMIKAIAAALQSQSGP